MIPSHLVTLTRKSMLMLLAGLPLAVHADNTLIVVEDLGGTSALPYYEALHLQPRGD
ncbi:TPA: integrating conjugative element protein, partial [Morganella morganii]|nr:integrating conjugative element protein [Morganella morganii]